MTNDNETPPPVDRETASNLNRFISDVSVLGTCKFVSADLKRLSFLVGLHGHKDVESEVSSRVLQDQLELFAAALDFEVEQEEEAKPEVREASVKRPPQHQQRADGDGRWRRFSRNRRKAGAGKKVN